MNVFASFTFGRLIKLFLPGFVVFSGVFLGLDVILGLVNDTDSGIPIPSNVGMLLAVVIPVTLICGLVLNSIYFAMRDKRIREWLKGGDDQGSDLSTVEERLKEYGERQLEAMWRSIDDGDEVPPAVTKHAGSRWLWSRQVDLDVFDRIRGYYRDYMEFQVLLSMSLVPLLVALLPWLKWRADKDRVEVWLTIVILVVAAGMVVLIIVVSMIAARKNSLLYRSSIATFYLSMYDDGNTVSKGTMDPSNGTG